jgi:endonuclease G
MYLFFKYKKNVIFENDFNRKQIFLNINRNILMKNKLILIAIVFSGVFISMAGGCKDKGSIFPEQPELPAPGQNEIVAHTAYTLSYSETHEQAEWVAYVLTADNAASELVERTDDFREDSSVSTGSAALSDYSGSGYDRGHLMPAGDCRWDETVMSESFFMSNMSPQDPQFNRVRWRFLESQVRQWAIDHGGLYIVTAGVLTDDLPSIGENEVAVPEYYYKVIVDMDITKGIAFYMPNTNLNDSQIQNFFTTIDSVEMHTGIDFFPWLSAEDELTIESRTDTSEWGFSYY